MYMPLDAPSTDENKIEDKMRDGIWLVVIGRIEEHIKRMRLHESSFEARVQYYDDQAAARYYLNEKHNLHCATKVQLERLNKRYKTTCSIHSVINASMVIRDWDHKSPDHKTIYLTQSPSVFL